MPLTINPALQTELDKDGCQPEYVVEIRPKRVAWPRSSTVIFDADLQSKLVTDQGPLVHRVSADGSTTRENDETSAVGVTRRTFGNSTVLAATLSGGSSYIRLGEGLRISGSFAFVVEFRANALANQDLFGIYRVDGASNVASVGLTSSGFLTANFLTSTVIQSAGAPYVAGRWHSLVAAFTSNVGQTDTVIDLYLDGVLVKTQSVTDNLLELGLTPIGPVYMVLIGNNQALSKSFAGKLGRVVCASSGPLDVDHTLDADDAADVAAALKGPIVACTGDTPILDYSLSVDDVTGLAGALDPSTRAKTRDRFEITFAGDGWLRELAARYRLASADVAVKLAIPGLNPADFALLGSGWVPDYQPEEAGENLTVRYHETAIQGSAKGAFIGHPLEVMGWLLEAAQVSPTRFDRDTLDISLYPDISHFQVARYGTEAQGWVLSLARDYQAAIGEGTPIKPLMDELAMLCGGSLTPGEYGTLEFSYYDPTTAALASWTADDISDLEQLETIQNLVNQFVFPAFFYKGASMVELIMEDRSAQEADAIGGLEPRVATERIQATEWVRSIAALHGDSDFSGSPPWTVGVRSAYLGMSGHGLSDAQRVLDGTQDAVYELGGGKYAYYAIGRTEMDSDGNVTQPQASIEILRIDSIEPSDWRGFGGITISSIPHPVLRTYNASATYESDRWRPTKQYFPYFSEINVGARAQYGTAPQAETYKSLSYLYDVTLPIWALQRRLDRFVHGCPILRFRTNLAKLKYKLGEFVTLTDDVILDYELDGVDSSTKWEIIGKEVDALGDTPGILWTVAKVVETTADTDADRSTAFLAGLQSIVGTTALPLHVPDTDSFTAAATTGLGYRVDSGRSGTLAQSVPGPSFEGTVEADSDTYLAFDISTGLFVQFAVDNGDPAPAISAPLMAVAKFVSNGSGITATTDQRPTRAFPTEVMMQGDSLGGDLGGVLPVPTVEAAHFSGVKRIFGAVVAGETLVVSGDGTQIVSTSGSSFNVNTILTSAEGSVLVNASGNVLVTG